MRTESLTKCSGVNHSQLLAMQNRRTWQKAVNMPANINSRPKMESTVDETQLRHNGMVNA